MFPFRYSTIFRSRWMALLWAAGICYMAYDFATPDKTDGNQAINSSDMPINSADVAAIQGELKQLN